MKRVRLYKRGDRGFYSIGAPLKDTCGSKIEVYESSSAEQDCVWLSVDASSWLQHEPSGSAAAHLNKDQAIALMRKLETWLNLPNRVAR